jgi:hypothetical protein
MNQQNPKRTQKQVLEVVKKELGIKRLEEFRRADLTSEIREKTGLTPEDEFRIMAVVDLLRLGLPLEVAEALGLSGALGSASELPALTPEEVDQILNEAPVKRLLPANFEINLELIEQWLQKIHPLTAEEEAPSRGAVAEDEEQGFANDNEPAVAMEDVSLNREIWTSCSRLTGNSGVWERLPSRHWLRARVIRLIFLPCGTLCSIFSLVSAM